MKRPRDINNDNLLLSLDQIGFTNGKHVYQVTMKMRKVDANTLKQAANKLRQLIEWQKTL